MQRHQPKPTTPILDLARNLPLGDLLALGTQLRADLTPGMLLQEVADRQRWMRVGFGFHYVETVIQKGMAE